MKKILLFCVSCLVINASELEIVSDKFEADENRGITVFYGNVHIKHNKDTIDTDKLTVTLDSKKKPVKYIADGNAKFKLYIKEKVYEGESAQIVYDSSIEKYSFEGNVILKELIDNNKITADKVFVNQKNGTYSVEGSQNKPAKFIFNIDEKK